MKNSFSFIYILLLIALFQSCDQSTSISQTDNRTKDELALVKLFDNAFESTMMQKNDESG
ncbi:hypothetical protein [Mucilaginibacter panaciglaebae]|uniref:Uncharacterized protein n=1 Tax=Mucilaginibacter panaciglaebae TaxID=502331 RepID=A0ABP7WNU0_9SPHI